MDLHFVVNRCGLSYGPYYMPKSIGTPAIEMSAWRFLEVKKRGGTHVHAAHRQRSCAPPATVARSYCVRMQLGLDQTRGGSGYPMCGWLRRNMPCQMAWGSALKGYRARGVVVRFFSTTCWNATISSASNWVPAQYCNSSSPS
jgi:hypothetical protein